MPDPEPPFDLPRITGRFTTASMPLRGMTILCVEDSRLAAEALRMICQRSGARLRRAETLAIARQHLRCYRPDVVLVDLNMPDGLGSDLVHEMVLRPSRPVLLGISADSGARSVFHAAGADGFIEKPVISLRAFQSTILDHLSVSPTRLPPGDWQTPCPDPLALRDDLMHALALLSGTRDDSRARFVAGFVEGIGRVAHDPDLTRAAHEARQSGAAAVTGLSALLARRLAAPVSPMIAPDHIAEAS